MTDLVSIIIVTYNNEKEIKECLSSIKQNTRVDYELLVIDNCSQDNTLEIIQNSGVAVELFPQSENLGFSKANNLGVTKSKGNYLLFLNPDTKTINGGIDQLLKFYKTHEPGIGIAAPCLVEDSGRIQPSVRKLPTIMGAVREYYFQVKGDYEPYSPKDEVVEVESVVGAAMLISKKVYQQVGGFDNKYFLYFEDLDLCRKILQSGLKILYQPTIKFKHSVGRSSRTNQKSAKYLKDSASIYHGRICAFLLNLILRFRIFAFA